MDKKIYKQLKSVIKKYNSIIIAKHVNPDWDAQGSAIGLANIINDNFNDKKIYVVGDRLDNDKSFSASKLSKKDIKESLLITVDTANTERIDFEEYEEVKEIFKIDHHLIVDQYGTYNMVDDTAIACTQVLTIWAKTMKLNISKIAAKNLYKGLLTDSGRFLFDKVNKETFEAAAILVDSGISLNDVQEELYLSDLKVRQWQNKAFSMMKMSKKNVAYIVAEPKDYEKYDLSYDKIKSSLFTMSGIKEIPIWCTIINIDNQFKVSLRSREYDVNSVAVKFNGGGHRLASGAKLSDLKEVPKLIKALDALIKK